MWTNRLNIEEWTEYISSTKGSSKLLTMEYFTTSAQMKTTMKQTLWNIYVQVMNKEVVSYFKKWRHDIVAFRINCFPHLYDHRITTLIKKNYEPYLISEIDNLTFISKKNKRKLYDFLREKPILEVLSQIDKLN